MNSKLYRFVSDIINIILRFLVAYSILMLILLTVTGNMEYIWSAWYLLPAPFASYLIGKRVQQLWLATILHILMVIIYLLYFHDIFLSTLFGLYLLALSGMTLAQRTKEKLVPVNTKIILLTIIVCCYWYCSDKNLVDLKQVFLGCAILFVLLYFINQYLINFIKYFMKQEDMVQMPMKQIMVRNHVLFASFGILCLGVMLIFTFFPMKGIISSLGRVVIIGLRAILSLFHHSPEKIGRISQDLDYVNPLPVYGDNLILKIIYYAILIAIIGATIVGIIYLCNYLYQNLNAKRGNTLTDKLEFISPFEDRKKIEAEHKSLRKIVRTIFGNANNEKIRKHYYNAIVTNSDHSLPTKEMTPTQLTKYAFPKGKRLVTTTADAEKEKELTDLYEKARYGREECSRKDLLRVKELLK